VVIELTEDIPNDGVQFSPVVPDDLRERIVDALVEIAETEEGKEALKTAYQWSGLERHGDTFYDKFRQVLQASGLTIEELQE